MSQSTTIRESEVAPTSPILYNWGEPITYQNRRIGRNTFVIDPLGNTTKFKFTQQYREPRQ